ncbi:aspartate aminotransferase family protein [Echinicola soli]|uniref:Aspartate aminotransferase family protein n=1 Tax=Echinicola soli TaxID=2591634 RepID=A0A514CM55_9BACT|nr:pyridoxal-dependent decarboxylase [Echinicola soli]QDH80837.1 aspartate aminotransferase family protein [Echinicola soli]
MHKILKTELNQLDELLTTAKEKGMAYLNSLSERPNSSTHQVTGSISLPEKGPGTLKALDQFSLRYEPLMVASSGPRFWGFVTGGTTPAAIVGDWLTSIYDQNTQTTKGHGDVSATIERETIQLLLELLQLPNDYLGGFVSGATMSNFTCLAVARQWAGHQLGKDFARDGISEAIPVLSATPHSSSIKCLAMLGIGSKNIIKIKTKSGNREAMDIAHLESTIANLDGKPFILISSAGTVNTVDFDDFLAIAKIKEKYCFWWHIDAAFGGFAACSPSYKQLLTGWEVADSITLDGHKWLNVPYESGIFLVKEEHHYLQVASFQNSNAPYLGDPMENFNYLNLLPENSRRLKALPVWFSLISYGREGYQAIVENCIALAKEFGQAIQESKRFELLAPIRLNTVCFSLKDQAHTASFLSSLNATGNVFMTPTVYQGKEAIRAAFVNYRTTKNDIVSVLKLMEEIGFQLHAGGEF